MSSQQKMQQTNVLWLNDGVALSSAAAWSLEFIKLDLDGYLQADGSLRRVALSLFVIKNIIRADFSNSNPSSIPLFILLSMCVGHVY